MYMISKQNEHVICSLSDLAKLFALFYSYFFFSYCFFSYYYFLAFSYSYFLAFSYAYFLSFYSS